MAEWKPISDYDGYEVSSAGQVRGPHGPLKSVANKGGYHVITLRKDGETHSKYVHDLVGHHFVKGYKKGLTVQHNDHNKNNNSAKNLSWLDGVHNSADGRLTSKTVNAVRKMKKKGIGNGAIAKVLRLKPEVVKAI